ncbi:MULTISPECIES: cupin domain-containing protein [Streptomyces violaceusniger group]|uniref:Cupin domain-containing protein n=2 Tax=Streptomyces javensis TaxID=114698 RepID=A0ABP4I332_9ACTN|nr:cupin domain-containing protein [Streptomyces javensis]MBI0314865.1 cupin domain-containing protein [Streptomyces javensis]
MATTRRPATAEWLGLEPHPEGGWYRETWRSDVTVRPSGYEGERATATAIYFLLTPGEESRWHVVRSAELWLWHSGGPLRLRLAGMGDAPEAVPTEVLLGPDVASGQRPQVVIPPGVWQAARPEADEEVLVSCVVSPGFDFADFRLLED